jgi:hypothetical protein
MAQDLRNLFEEDKLAQRAKMSQDHEARFLEKLNKELPIEKKSSGFSFLNIAASVVILLGLSFGAYKYFQDSPIDVEPEKEVVDTDLRTLGDVSPDLKKVEDYYLASINLELSKVELTPQNKELFDGYVLRLQELNKEYDKLLEELNESGPNSVTLDALIENLKLRLNLVMRLKDKLEEFNDDAFEQEIT